MAEATGETANFGERVMRSTQLAQMSFVDLQIEINRLKAQLAGLTPTVTTGADGWRHYGVVTQTALLGIEYELDVLRFLAADTTVIVAEAAAEMAGAVTDAQQTIIAGYIGNAAAITQYNRELGGGDVSAGIRISRAMDDARAGFSKVTQEAQNYGRALGYVSEEQQKLTEARQRFISTFNQEIAAKPEEGLIGAEGLVNVEAMNQALYRQVEAAGASAATLALLGVATGQFTEEQAEAALKAAILQEQINQIAEAVVAGKITLDQALGQLGEAQASINQADLITVAQNVAAIPEADTTVDVTADTSEANKAIGTVQSTLSILTDSPYLTTLDVDIAALLTGTDEAKRAIDAVPSQLTVTINWAQAGADVIGALQALGVTF
jgi:hypothetical protein